MRLNPQETADLVTFTEKILNGKLYFCAVRQAFTNVGTFFKKNFKSIAHYSIKFIFFVGYNV